MKPMYLCIICAPKSLQQIARPLAELSAEIKTASNGDLVVALKTDASITLAFTSEVPPAHLEARLRGLAFQDMRFALFATNQLIGGFLDGHALEWMARRLAPRPPT